LLAAQICVSFTLLAADPGQSNTSRAQSEASIAGRIKKNYLEARSHAQTETNNLEAAWQYARACFDLAESMTNNTERAKVAEEGIAVSRKTVARQPGLVQAHYYLGMNLGQLADTKRNMASLKIVDEMEREFKAALTLDERFDFAGADRNLGLLYWEAPALLSIGSRSKARQHLQRAVELAPDYPGNRLNLIEAFLKWGDRNDAVREVKSLKEIWPGAHQKYTGDEWIPSWLEWETRFQKAQNKVEEPAKPAETPRHPD
jgi:tetratricopeptide (TPR) repeat protein